jgi:hypothetical protein
MQLPGDGFALLLCCFDEGAEKLAPLSLLLL